MSKHIWWKESWNLVTGCNNDKVSPACDNCYARETAKTRLRGKYGYPEDEPFRVTVHRDKFDQPFHWRKPRRIVVCSMGDLFHPMVPGEVHDQVFYMAYMAKQHTYLLCTKRAERIEEAWTDTAQFRHGITSQVVSRIHLGTTVECQATVKRIDHLLDAPAAMHWVSFEPLLGPVEVPSAYWARLDWIVIGCETGPKRRRCKSQWVKSLVDQAKATNTPVWIKQFDIGIRVSYDPAEWPEWARLRQLPREVS